MEKKYVMLNDDTIDFKGRRLHRIQAVMSFGDVKKGDLGGYIESYNNLSLNETCWVYDNAKVIGHAYIGNDSKVYGEAVIMDRAKLWNNCVARDNAIVSDNVLLYGHYEVGGDTVLNGWEMFYLSEDDKVDNGKKYEILKDDTIKHTYQVSDDDCFKHRTLYRIKALKDFGHVKKGELGGYVEHDRNLSQIGECWVADEARVMDYAYVYDNALIMEQAVVMGNAQVSDDVIVRGDYIVDRSMTLKGDGVYGLKEDEDDEADDWKKYEILKDDTIRFVGRTLYRIKALKDFSFVRKGDIGGYVEGEYNLSQKGDCWIDYNSNVMDEAYITDNACIMSDSTVMDNAIVSDNAIVLNRSTIEGNALVRDNAVVRNTSTVKDQAVVKDNAVIYNGIVLRKNYVVGGDTILTVPGVYEGEESKADNINDDSEDDQAAERHNDGKLQWSLVDFECLEPLVKALEYGENKYSSFNWKKGMKQTKIIESLLRHTFAYLGGEDNDTESGVSHIGHIMSNAMFLANSAKHPEWDDRFKGLSNSKKTIKKVNPWYEEDI